MLTSPLCNPLSSSLAKHFRRYPLWGTVLAFHPGLIEDDIYLRDYAKAFGDYPLQMVDGPCLTFNGIDEYGTFDTVTLIGAFEISIELEPDSYASTHALLSDGTFSNYIKLEGLVQSVKIDDVYVPYTLTNPTGASILHISRDDGADVTIWYEGGTPQTKTVSSADFPISNLGQYSSSNYFNGKFWNIHFNGTHFPCIGKTNTVNPTSTFATDGTEMTIVSSDYIAIWPRVQQSYFCEVPNGYWEDVNGRYPFAKSGATFVPSGWNYPQNGFKYKENGVGLFDITDTITLTEDHGTLDSYDGDATVTYVHPTISATAGYARTLTFSSGTVIPLNDGQKYGNDTTDIHDSNGNVVGELVSADVPEFHSVTKVPFEIQQADLGVHFYTDPSTGKALTFYQSTLEELGAEEYDGAITEATNSGTFTDNNDGTYTITSSTTGFSGVRDNDAEYLDIGTEYEVSHTTVAGAIFSLVVFDSGYTEIARGIGSVRFTPTTIETKIYICDIPGETLTTTVKDISVREVNPIMNQTGKDWFSPLRGIIKDKDALTGDDFTTREKWMGLP